MFRKYFSVFWKKYKFRSMVFKNAVKMFVVFFIFLMCVMLFIYKYAMSDVSDAVLKSNSDSVKMFAATIESLVRDTEYLAAEVMADSDISYFMSMGENVLYGDEEIELIVKKINAYIAGKTIIDSVYVYNTAPNILCTDKMYGDLSQFTDVSWVKELDGDFSENYKIILRQPDDMSKPVFTLIKRSKTNRSAVLVNIDIHSLEKYMAKDCYGDVSFYIVQPQKIFYTNLLENKRNKDIENLMLEMIKNDLTGDIVKSGSDSISISTEKSTYYDWYYVSMSQNDGYVSIVRALFVRVIIIFLLMLILCIIVSLFLAINNTLQFVTILDLFENRDKYAEMDKNEIREVADKIILLMEDNDFFKSELVSRNEQYEKWKIMALQTQITPHFLNNTLAVINYEVIDKCEHGENISAMISKLSRILSYTMVTEKTFVTLAEELDFIKDYADLLKLRYDNFALEIDVEQQLLSCKVLRMSLQPIIENSVFHGYKEDGGTIYISCKENDNNIVITVKDKGKGMSEEKVAYLMSDIGNNNITDKNVGIKNIYKRMEAVYGKKTVLKIESEVNGFTIVKIQIPKEM